MSMPLSSHLCLFTCVTALSCATQSTSSGVATEAFREQATKGAVLYGEHCSRCHGDSGEGSDEAPRLVGLSQGALPLDPPAGRKARTMQFRTVADIAGFAVKNMPPKKAGSLPEEDYWRILAFDLKANGIDLGDKHLDGALAPTLVVPR